MGLGQVRESPGRVRDGVPNPEGSETTVPFGNRTEDCRSNVNTQKLVCTNFISHMRKHIKIFSFIILEYV